MLDKMSGPRDKRFSSYRTFLAYMMAHPGKKLIFMGQEFAQFSEWNYQTGLDWDVQEFPEHKQFSEYVKKLNEFYRDRKELWEKESDWSCFSWIVSDDNTNSVIAFRRIDPNGNELIFVANFLPKDHDQYSFGVPFDSDYEQIFSTEDKVFGGEGKYGKQRVSAVQVPMHGENQSVTVKLPGMSALFFKPVKKKGINRPEEKFPEIIKEKEVPLAGGQKAKRPANIAKPPAKEKSSSVAKTEHVKEVKVVTAEKKPAAKSEPVKAETKPAAKSEPVKTETKPAAKSVTKPANSANKVKSDIPAKPHTGKIKK
jgi:1,4-alpha-glucan branching enzyme